MKDILKPQYKYTASMYFYTTLFKQTITKAFIRTQNKQKLMKNVILIRFLEIKPIGVIDTKKGICNDLHVYLGGWTAI